MNVRRSFALAAACVLLAAGIGPLFATAARALDISTITVPMEYRTGRVLLVRPTRLDIVLDGRVTRALPLTGPLDLAELPAMVADPSYVSRPAPGVVQLAAVLAQRPQSTVVGASPRLLRLELLGPAARILGTRSTLRMQGVTVAAVTASGRLAPVGPRRGFIRYVHGSQVSLTDVALQHLGSDGPDGSAAMQVSGSGEARLERTLVTGATVGISLQDLESMTLIGSSASGSSDDGVVVRGGGRLRLESVAADGNSGDGIVVMGPLPSITTAGTMTVTRNRGDGLRLIDLQAATVRGVTSAGNHDAGISLRTSRGIALGSVDSRADATAIAVRGSSAVRLSDVHTSGGQAGVVIKESRDVALARFSSTGARDEAIALAAQQVLIANATVRDAGEGIVVSAAAQHVSLRDSSIQGLRSAIRIAAGASLVDLTRIQAAAVGAIALRSSGTHVTVSDLTADGAVGVDLRGTASILSARIEGVTAGMHVGPGGRVSVRQTSVTARDVGISAAQDARVLVSGSRVYAVRAVDGPVDFSGGNSVSPLPIRWIAMGGISALVLAIALELIRKGRERGDAADSPTVPGHVLNRT